jgi:hypothetical protein
VDANLDASLNRIHSLPCRNPCPLFIHLFSLVFSGCNHFFHFGKCLQPGEKTMEGIKREMYKPFFFKENSPK